MPYKKKKNMGSSTDWEWLDEPEDHRRWGVRVGDSHLLPAEKGLFAERHFDKGERIAPYLGEELTATERKARYSDRWGSYVYFKPWGHPSIDAQFYRGAAAFANDGAWEIEVSPNTYTKRKPDLSNAALSRGWLLAKRPIKSGDEILLDYGEGYWKRRFEGEPGRGNWQPKLLFPEDLDIASGKRRIGGAYSKVGQSGGGDAGASAMPGALTPVEKRGDYWFKRDDLFEAYGVHGGKVRTCLAYILGRGQGSPSSLQGLVTGGSRSSPQVQIVGHLAAGLGLPARLHLPKGKLPDYVREATFNQGHEVFQWFPGFNHVLSARARQDVEQLGGGWLEIPFGMEVPEAIEGTAAQVANLPFENPQFKRIVVPVGSGMTLAGILQGLKSLGSEVPVLGVVVGQDPKKRLDRWAPEDWRERVQLVRSELDYHKQGPTEQLEGVPLDPIYEAKVVPYLRSGDLIWIVGHR